MPSTAKEQQAQNDLRPVALLDVDHTLFFQDLGGSYFNEELVAALVAQNIKDVYLFTNMSLSDIAEKNDNSAIFSRPEIIAMLQALGLTVHGVMTPADPAYARGLGAAYRDFYEPQYARVIGDGEGISKDELDADQTFSDAATQFKRYKTEAETTSHARKFYTVKGLMYEYFLENKPNWVESCLFFDDAPRELNAARQAASEFNLARQAASSALATIPLTTIEASREKKTADYASQIKAHAKLRIMVDNIGRKFVYYPVEKPHYTAWQWFKFIAVRVILPVILLWDIIKLAVNKWLGEFVGTMVLPASRNDPREIGDGMSREAVDYLKQNQLDFERFKVKTHDGAELDSIEITNSALHAASIAKQVYIVHFCANGMIYEEGLQNLLQEAVENNCNVIGFNYRGVVQSKKRATSAADLATDGIAQVQRLLDKGVEPKNIILSGFSLGGAVGTLVAQHFHQQNRPVNIFNDRSFSSITNFTVGKIRQYRNGHQTTLGRKIGGWLAKPFIGLGLALTKWEIDAATAFKQLPQACKEYTFVRSHRSVRTIAVLDDTMITHYASLHAALKRERVAQKNQLNDLVVAKDTTLEDADSLTTNALIQAKLDLKQARAQFSYRKMTAATAKDINDGHEASPTELINRQGITAKTFFMQFVHKIKTKQIQKIDNKSPQL